MFSAKKKWFLYKTCFPQDQKHTLTLKRVFTKKKMYFIKNMFLPKTRFSPKTHYGKIKNNKHKYMFTKKHSAKR